MNWSETLIGALQAYLAMGTVLGVVGGVGLAVVEACGWQLYNNKEVTHD